MTNLEWRLRINDNEISDLRPLGTLTKLRELFFKNNRVTDISPLETLTELRRLDISGNRIRDLSPLETLTELQALSICYNRYTDISPIENLVNLTSLYIDKVFVDANEALVAETTTATLILCPPLPEPTSDPPTSDPPTSEPKVKHRRVITQCGLGWTPAIPIPALGRTVESDDLCAGI